jgi:dsRNA-specific ribonuclease
MTSTRESKELNRRRSALETYVEPLLGANNTNTNSEDANAMVVSEFMSTFNKLMTFYESDFKQELSKFPETVGKY